MSKPLIGIFVRHSAECKHADDELYRRWSCRQHLRWTHNGVQYRKTAGTGSWADAEQAKCTLEEQLAGRTCAPSSENNAQAIAGAVSLFIADKKVQGLTPDLIKKYTLWLGRLRTYCEGRGVFVVKGIPREPVTGLCEDWPKLYPSTYTRAKLRER